ncbi:MAG: hypothetical protein NT045_06255 [Candidatus Aureabacteria bacterium]|nr:hypothetical protein [Candidatus Auribacterota bacterium]
MVNVSQLELSHQARKEGENVRSWIILTVVAVVFCFCGMLIAQEQPSESPATTSDVVTVKEAPPAAGGAAPADTATATTVKEEEPAKPVKESAPAKPVTE